MLDLTAGPGAQVTPEHTEAYVAEMKARVGSVTVYGSIHKLRRIVQLIAPDRDIGWLIDIERELFSEMRPRSKWDRTVYTDVLEEAGLTLMAEAEMSKRPKLTRATDVPQRAYDCTSRSLSHPPQEFRCPRNRTQLCQCRWHLVDCPHCCRNERKARGRAAQPRRSSHIRSNVIWSSIGPSWREAKLGAMRCGWPGMANR